MPAPVGSAWMGDTEGAGEAGDTGGTGAAVFAVGVGHDRRAGEVEAVFDDATLVRDPGQMLSGMILF